MPACQSISDKCPGGRAVFPPAGVHCNRLGERSLCGSILGQFGGLAGDQRNPGCVRIEIVHSAIRCANRTTRRFVIAAFDTDPHWRRGARA